MCHFILPKIEEKLEKVIRKSSGKQTSGFVIINIKGPKAWQN